MPLPILQAGRDASAEDLVRLYHRTELHWTRHLADEAQLGCGTAFTSKSLSRVWDANRVLDAALPPGVALADALAEVDAYFRTCGTQCAQWTMNPSSPADQTAPLVEHLTTKGWVAVACDVLRLTAAPSRLSREAAGLTIIPARASFRHARRLAELAAEKWYEPQVADAALLHLDDPHWDAMIAMVENDVIAGVGVLAVGEIGRIDNLFVAKEYRQRGVGQTMMSRILDTCARSLFRHVMLAVEPGNAAAQSLYVEMGFRKVGQIVNYRARWTQ